MVCSHTLIRYDRVMTTRCPMARTVTGSTPVTTSWTVQAATGSVYAPSLLDSKRAVITSTLANMMPQRVGSGTEATFSNAFLRVMGVRPGAYGRYA